MHKKRERTLRGGFTLLEVMIAVMILSVVIMALVQMYANGAHIFKTVTAKREINQYISLLAANQKYGFESSSFSLDRLVEDFEIEDGLRRELKNVKVKLLFENIENEKVTKKQVSELKADASSASNAVFGLGRVVLKIDDAKGAEVAKTSFLRLRTE